MKPLKWLAFSVFPAAVVAFDWDPETAEMWLWAAVAVVVALIELAGVAITARATVKAAGLKAMVEALQSTDDEESDDE